MKFLILLVTYITFVSAINLEEPKEGRTIQNIIQSTDGFLYLSLNNTLLQLGVAGLFIALIASLVMGSGALPLAAQNIQRKAQEFSEELFVETEGADQLTRYKRFADNDIASKMAQLEQAFKKYQVEEAECEMYIACEASQVQRIEENGPLARIVFDILSTFNREKDGHKWDDRMEGLVKAFEFGTGASASGQVDPCQPLRNKCFELHAKY